MPHTRFVGSPERLEDRLFARAASEGLPPAESVGPWSSLFGARLAMTEKTIEDVDEAHKPAASWPSTGPALRHLAMQFGLEPQGTPSTDPA